MKVPENRLTRRRLILLVVVGLGGGALFTRYIDWPDGAESGARVSTEGTPVADSGLRIGFGVGRYGQGGYGQ